MNSFEDFLIKKGYIKYVLDCKTMTYELAEDKIISSMSNLDFRYIHSSKKSIFDKIKNREHVSNFSMEEKNSIICFGLHEYGKPITLISPRPKIRVIKEDNGKIEHIDNGERFDDFMNIVLMNESNEKILKSLFDKSICFEYNDIKTTKNEYCL